MGDNMRDLYAVAYEAYESARTHSGGLVAAIEAVKTELEQASKDSIEFHRHCDWTMVYLNGDLKRAGDHHLADEWLQEFAGVKVVDDSVCMKDSHAPYRTLAEVHAATQRRDDARSEAARLRQQAAELERRAKELEEKSE